MKGQVLRRGDNWYIRYDAGKDPVTGKRRQIQRKIPGTKRDAERALAKAVSEIQDGMSPPPRRLTVGEYLERWLVDYAEGRVAARTFHRYQQIVRRHLVPALGSRRLDNLTPGVIQQYYTQALREGRLHGDSGLSPQTVMHHHRLLSLALRQAVRWQLLSRNPAELVEPPVVRRSESQFLDTEQIAALLDAARGNWLYVLILLAVTTGMRLGEILGLRWSDIDLDRGVIRVVRALASADNRADTAPVFKAPKSGKGRLVHLPRAVVPILAEYRQEQKERAEMNMLKPPELVVCEPEGRPTRPHLASRRFRSWMDRQEGLPRIRFHDLRHSHATVLLSQGVHPKVVSERLGHSKVGITLDTYSHVLPSLGEEAAGVIDQILGHTLVTHQGTDRET